MKLTLVFPFVLAACSTFGSNASEAPAASAAADAATEASAPVDASVASADPAFVGSRLLTFTAAPVTVLSPAGVRAGDVLVSSWLGGPMTTQRFPAEWIELGRTQVGDSNNGGITTLLVGYHVLSDSESDETTYTFDGSNGQVLTVAYRNVSRKQPCTPVTVSGIQTAALGGGRAALEVPGFQTRGPSLPLYVFGIVGSTTYPALSDLDLVEATNSLAAYRARTAVPAGASVTGPHVEITVGGAAPKVMVASLAVVGP